MLLATILVVLFPVPLIAKLTVVLICMIAWVHKVEWVFDKGTGSIKGTRSVFLLHYRTWNLRMDELESVNIRRAGRGDGLFDYRIVLCLKGGKMKFVARRGTKEKIVDVMSAIQTYLPDGVGVNDESSV